LSSAIGQSAISGMIAGSAVDRPGTATAPDIEPRVGETEIAMLRRDGFLLVKGLASKQELESLQVPFDRLFSQRLGWNEGYLFDMIEIDSAQQELALPQHVRPSKYEPLLRQSKLAASARSIARQILGPKLENDLEHAVYKPPFSGAATPWHQDDAFHRKGSGVLESISVWMPLQDVSLENGCMQYIRGSNLGPLYPHRSPHNDPRIHGLETVSIPDLASCVQVAVCAGDAVIHLSRTLHSAGINRSDQPRRAYVLGFSVRTRRDRFLTRDYPWNLEKQTAREERALSALSPFKRTVKRFKRFVRGKRF
jgi:Phytanoyl-CoA dioxygenase (PhyH)